MMSIYKRLGVTPLVQVIRFVKLLSVDHKIENLIGEGVLAKAVTALGNRLLAIKDWKRREKGCEITIHSGPFGEEFTELDQRLAGRFPLCLARTSAYLNWRYLENPLLEYQVLTARRDHELLGFAILAAENQQALLVDFFADTHAFEIDELLAGVIEISRQANLRAVHAPVLEGSPLTTVLAPAGFYPREGTALVVCTQTGSRLAELVAEPANWWLTHGDRDV